MTKTKNLWKFGIVLVGVFVLALTITACDGSGNSPLSKSKISMDNLKKSAEELNWEDRTGSQMWASELSPFANSTLTKPVEEKLLFSHNFQRDNSHPSDHNLYARCKKYNSFEEAKDVVEKVKADFYASGENNIYNKTVSYEVGDNTVLWKTTSQVCKENNIVGGASGGATHDYLYYYVDNNYVFYTWYSSDYVSSSVDSAISEACKLINALGLPEW